MAAALPVRSASPPRWTSQWLELKAEVIDTGLCTGCAGCVVACPHDVIGYRHEGGGYRPFHLEDELGPDDCAHGQRGCTSCTRACPRFRDWEPGADQHLFGRVRSLDEVSGIAENIVLARATDPVEATGGQDGGLVTAILLWLLEEGYIDGALVSHLDKSAGDWKAVPGVATTPEEIRAAAGSRYTYSANTLALDEAAGRGLRSLALVGPGCQTSVLPVMWRRRAGKVARTVTFNIGLLCSKTFDDAIFEELLWDRYGLARSEMARMNIKGVLQIWMRDGSYHEVPLAECHAWTRRGCTHCPDFAAEHADISAGGITSEPGWTLTVVRTPLGHEVIERMLAAGLIQSRPGAEDPEAIARMHRLSTRSRQRWPDSADRGPSLKG